ncbi:MAG: hypothetical protein JWO06_862 [Bacteroidota bacterium]|nr:hypothetical protein [Bacteroidota bacterium]
MSRQRSHTFINLVSVAVILIILEITSRFVLHKIYNRDFDSSLITEHKYFDSPGLKPNAKGLVWGKEFNTDALGGRKNKVSTQKKKWLYIGDSVTEGVGVEDSSTFAYKVSVADSQFCYENISMIGYSTPDYLNVLKATIASDSSLNRVTLFFCLNDVYGSAKTKDLPVMRKQNLLGKLNAILQEHYATYKLLKLYRYRNADRYFKYDLEFYSNQDKHFKEAMADVLKCDSLCKSKGIGFSLVTLPYRSQIIGKDENERTPQKSVAEFCRAHDILFADPANHLAGLENRSSLYLFADEIHFSAKGHSALAEFLLVYQLPSDSSGLNKR